MVTGLAKRAVFLDRDGVLTRLITERGPRETALTAEDVQLLPGVIDALRALRASGFLLVVVTNQPNVAKGKSTHADFLAIETKINQLLGPQAVPDMTYACQHHPDAAQVVVPDLLKECDCRKPQPGLIQRGLIDFKLDPTTCFMVGDAESDLQAGAAAGIPLEHLIFVGSKCNTVAICVPDLKGATQYIMAKQA